MSSTEARPSMPQGVERVPLKKRFVEGFVDSGLGRAAIRLAIPLVIEEGTALLEFDSDSVENIGLLKEPLSKGHKLIIVANHQSQGDVGPMVFVANAVRQELSSEIEGYDFFVAKTMGGGQQGKLVQTLYSNGINPWLERHNITPLEVVSDNDVVSRGVSKDRVAMFAAVRALKKEHRGILMFPEGTTTGGKENESGELNGVGRMSDSSEKLIKYIVESAIPTVFLPIGTDGTYELFDPDTKNFTPLGLRMISAQIAYRIQGVRNAQECVGSFKIGKPFTNSDLALVSDPALEVMARIAQLVPEKARGIFK